jgi:hypothetical protein
MISIETSLSTVGGDGPRRDWFTLITARSDSWKIAQRWRSLTSGAAISRIDASVWEKHAYDTADEILALVSVGLCRSPHQLESLRSSWRADALGIFKSAYKLALTTRRDYLSAQMQVSVADLGQELDVSRAENRWSDIPAQESDRVVANYSFGLEKVDERAQRTVLLRSKVVTQSVIRPAGK